MKIRIPETAFGKAEINVIPLLDVVFSILAVFVLIAAGLAVPPRLGIDLPQSERKTSDDAKIAPVMLIVTLDKTGITRIDNRQLSDRNLEGELLRFRQRQPRGVVVLNAEDKTVPYQRVVDLLEKLRKIVGEDRVAIATSRS